MTIGLFTQEFLDQSQLWLDIKNSVCKVRDLYGEPNLFRTVQKGGFLF